MAVSNIKPKKSLFLKQHRTSPHGSKTRVEIKYAQYGIQVLSPGIVKGAHVEGCRILINRSLRKTSKVFIRQFPHTSVTSKPLGVRMGRGKGVIDHYSFRVSRGDVVYEFDAPTQGHADAAWLNMKYNYPVDTRLITREVFLQR